DSPVVLAGAYREPRPVLPPSIEVVEARGCDRRPVDPTSPDGALTLRSFVWPDQVDRLALLDGALTIAARARPHVDDADAAEWLADHVTRPAAGVTTVVYHSIVWSY